MLGQSSPRTWNKMMQKSTTFTTIFRVKKCHFHYDMQKTLLNYPVNDFFFTKYCPYDLFSIKALPKLIST
jgi:hypothetical protein